MKAITRYTAMSVYVIGEVDNVYVWITVCT